MLNKQIDYIHDPVLDINYAQARMYDANSKRFLAVDPWEGELTDPQTLVKYTYVINNPLKYIDPFGLEPEDEANKRCDDCKKKTCICDDSESDALDDLLELIDLYLEEKHFEDLDEILDHMMEVIDGDLEDERFMEIFDAIVNMLDSDDSLADLLEDMAKALIEETIELLKMVEEGTLAEDDLKDTLTIVVDAIVDTGKAIRDRDLIGYGEWQGALRKDIFADIHKSVVDAYLRFDRAGFGSRDEDSLGGLMASTFIDFAIDASIKFRDSLWSDGADFKIGSEVLRMNLHLASHAFVDTAAGFIQRDMESYTGVLNEMQRTVFAFAAKGASSHYIWDYEGDPSLSFYNPNYAQDIAEKYLLLGETLYDLGFFSRDTGSGGMQFIPSIMQLNGESEQEQLLARRLGNLNRVPWNQTKVDELWNATNQIYNEFGVAIDPRFLLAIIIAEGTGSFNTSSTNRAADGGHGVETDYARDLMRANHLVFGKILGYIYYGDDFREVVNSNNTLPGIGNNADIFQYSNWNTPIIRLNSNRVDSGVYAEHSDWNNNVRRLYENLSYPGAAVEYDSYLRTIDKSIVVTIAENITLPNVAFEALQNARDNRAILNGNFTVTGTIIR